MKKIKFIISVWICKILVLVSRLTGANGSAAPGKYALKICPDAIRIAASMVKKKIIVTCGTNGKTTTNNLINSVLSKKGKTVCNSVGANMINGITTAFLSATAIWGRLNCDYAVLEIDEAYAVKVFDHFIPDIINITNLFRDQLDRYGEIEYTQKVLIDAVNKAPNATLVINGDDPVCYGIAYKTGVKTVSYSITETVNGDIDDTKDGKFCSNCGKELVYNYYHYSQLGDYRCDCGFSHPDSQYKVSDISLSGGISFSINGDYKVRTDYRGFYNIYNILSCYAVIKETETENSLFEEVLAEFKPQFGRMEKFNIGKPVILNLSKNPAGFNQAIRTVISDSGVKDIIISVNDNRSDGTDISWFWDVGFEKLADEQTGKIAVSGLRKDELAVRLKYADIKKEVYVASDFADAVSYLKNTGSDKLYALVNYTEIFNANKLLSKLEKEYNGN